jgi:putative aminopeptidase FrvX
VDQLLQELTELYAPSALEDELRRFVTAKLERLCDEVTTDACGNVIGLVRPSNPSPLPAITILTHMDEISMVVKRIDSSGQVRISGLGGFYPASIGQGPVDLIVGAERIPGILSFGSAHVTSESSKIWVAQPDGGGKALTWENVYVFTGRTKAELIDLGVHPGTRVVIHKCRRSLFRFHNYLSGFFLDNRAAIAVALSLAEKLQAQREALKATISLAMTTAEENGALGAAFLANRQPDSLFVAVDVGPAEAEYDVELSDAPVIVYGEGRTMLSTALCERLVATAQRRGLPIQKAYFERLGSDASRTILYGAAATACLVALPTQNTHGFEIINHNVIENAAELLLHFAISSTD